MVIVRIDDINHSTQLLKMCLYHELIILILVACSLNPVKNIMKVHSTVRVYHAVIMNYNSSSRGDSINK